MDYARRTPWHNLYNTQPIASFQQDPTILSLTGPAYRCRVSLFLFSVLFLHTPEHQPPTLPGSAWMARNCHDWWWHTENANHELAVTLSLTFKHKTRVSRIFQPSKRSGSVRKPSFSVYYFVSLSHLFTLPWLGTDWWWRTLWEPSRTPKMSTPAAGPLAHDTERSQQAAFFFLSGPALITSRVSLFFFVFVFLYDTFPILWITQPYYYYYDARNEEEEDLTAASGQSKR